MASTPKTLLTLTDVSLAYGHQPLLKNINLGINPGQRICLVGRNGTGKSTLFRIISGLVQPDEGEIWHRDTLRISYLRQEIPEHSGHTVFSMVASGLGNVGELLTRHHECVNSLAEDSSRGMQELAGLQQQIEVEDGWDINRKIETVLSRLDLPPDQPVAACSGGIRRRVMLARALVSDPDLLLLDEPTNHMDIASIKWLEEYLLDFPGSIIFITHDRTLVRHLATHILELDRGNLSSFPGDFDTYLRKKEDMLAAEAKTNARLEKKLAGEEAWLRQGIKARRTRNEGRLRKLQAMRLEKQRRLDPAGSVSLAVDDRESSGKRVAELSHVSFSFGDKCIMRDFSTRLLRGDRVGIMGPNGCGKSTLLHLLVGDLGPDSGKVILGTRLQFAYFDQQRTQLQPEKTVRENISDGSDYVNIRGHSRHVIGYMKDFLFAPERIDSPVKSLSGGECNRLLLARIFTRPANVLVLDEPTNDLDVETLELLEDLLADFDGTLILVSHDRSFLDNVVTSTVVFEGEGNVREYVGGYEDWLRQRPQTGGQPREEPAIPEPGRPAARNQGHPREKRKLSYHEQQELATLPDRIESLEAERRTMEQEVSDPAFYKQEKSAITGTLATLDELRESLEQAYSRWAYLDDFEG